MCMVWLCVRLCRGEDVMESLMTMLWCLLTNKDSLLGFGTIVFGPLPHELRQLKKSTSRFLLGRGILLEVEVEG